MRRFARPTLQRACRCVHLKFSPSSPFLAGFPKEYWIPLVVAEPGSGDVFFGQDGTYPVQVHINCANLFNNPKFPDGLVAWTVYVGYQVGGVQVIWSNSGGSPLAPAGTPARWIGYPCPQINDTLTLPSTEDGTSMQLTLLDGCP